jgi:prevent-host-death family protein
MKEVALSEMKDDLSRYLRMAEKEEIVITRHGKAAGVLIGFESEDDWFDYRLENDPRFLNRIAQARASLRVGRGVRLEDLSPPGPNTYQASAVKRTKRSRHGGGGPARRKRRGA